MTDSGEMPLRAQSRCERALAGLRWRARGARARAARAYARVGAS